MLEIERIKKRFESDSLAEMIREYDRDFIKQPPAKDANPPNPPPERSDELFPPMRDSEKPEKTS